MPLRLRNRLAEIILRALHDPAARRQLEHLAGDPAPAERWIEDAGREHGPLLRERADQGEPVVWTDPDTEVAEAIFALARRIDGAERERGVGIRKRLPLTNV